MRAREPDDVGAVVRDGVRISYEVCDGPEGAPTVLLLTSWAIVHMRQWKLQVPFLARHFRVVIVEGRGNGAPTARGCRRLPRRGAHRGRRGGPRRHGDRPGRGGRAVDGRPHALQFAAFHPERVTGVVAIGTALPWPLPPGFDEVREHHEGWEKANAHYWLADYPGWVEFFASQIVHEPHSTKQLRTRVGWGLETDAETLLIDTRAGDRRADLGRRGGDLPRGALPGARRARRRGRRHAVRRRRRGRRVDGGDRSSRSPAAATPRPCGTRCGSTC